MLAFETVARVLHFLHLGTGVVALASCTHLLVRLVKSRRDARVRTHARILAVAYTASYALGALMYPTFRVRVRADFLDRTYPWATGLFEIKEHSASLLLIPALSLVVLSRALDARTPVERRHFLLLGGVAALVWSVLAFNAGVGWYLGTLRSV